MKNYNSFSTPFEINFASTELEINLSSSSYSLNKTRLLPNIKQFAAAMSVAKIARPVTVQIYTSSGASGSGVIIKRQEDVYTVLIANHLVKQTNAQYMIHTHMGNTYPATYVRQLSSNRNMSDLVTIQFSTSDVYPVATLSHTGENLLNTDAYVSGYFPVLDFQLREFKVIKGMIVNCSPHKSWHYSTLTASHMSCCPVFNSQGQVVGIYITQEVDQGSELGVKDVVCANLFIPMDSLKKSLCYELKPILSQSIKLPELALH